MRSSIALVCLATAATACMEQAPSDRALAEIEAVRHDIRLREERLRTLEAQQAALMQQMSLVLTLANSTRPARKEDARDHQLGELRARMSHLSTMLTAWRNEEHPPAAAARPPASPRKRKEVIQQVQELLDTGQVKLTVRGGRVQLVLLRPIDTTDPYLSGPDKPPTAQEPAPPRPPGPTLRAAESLGY